MAQQDPFFYLPGWWRSSSGLLLPSTIQRTPTPPPVRVPDELLPEPKPILAGKFELSDFDQIAIYVDEAAIHIEPSSVRKLREVASSLNFEAAMFLLGHIAGKIYALRGDREAQLRLARETFPKAIYERIEIFFNEHANAELYSEQQIFILQRLLVERATGTIPHDLTEQENAIVGLSVIACGSVIEAVSTTAVKQARELQDWLAFFVQNGAYNTKPTPMGQFARAEEIYGRIARDPDRQSHDKFCPLDEWMLEDYGFDLEEQMTLGFALSAMSHAWDDDWSAGTQCYIPPHAVDDLFTKLGWQERKDVALAFIAADREQLRREFEELGDQLEHVVWETRPFMRHPFLRCENGGLILLSTRAILSWLGDGFHYRLLDSAQKRAVGEKKHRTSRRYTAYAGVLFERYVLDLVRSS